MRPPKMAGDFVCMTYSMLVNLDVPPVGARFGEFIDEIVNQISDWLRS